VSSGAGCFGRSDRSAQRHPWLRRSIRLHDVGCQRDKAGNRRLHFDHYGALILLFLLNPVLRSFRALKAASRLEQVRRKVGCSRTSLGSLS
jgi:hypothetical protein